MLSICKFNLFEDDSMPISSIGDEAVVDDFINDPLHNTIDDIRKYDEQKEMLRNNSGNVYGRYGGFLLPPGEHKTFDMPELRHYGPEPSENLNGIAKRLVFPEYRLNTGNELVDSLPKYYNINSTMGSLRHVGETGLESAGNNIENRFVNWIKPLDK